MIDIPHIGSIFVGSRLVGGVVHHIFIPGGTIYDIQTSQEDADEAIAAKGKINGHADWRTPDIEDLMLAYINVRDKFYQTRFESIYVSRTVRDGWAWAVDFENGLTRLDYDRFKFSVRPFRSIVALSNRPYTGA